MVVNRSDHTYPKNTQQRSGVQWHEPAQEACLHFVAPWTLLHVYIKSLQKAKQGFLAKPQLLLRTAVTCIQKTDVGDRGHIQLLQLSQSSISGGRSLVQQIHNLCNLKNTCDNESKWEWEAQKHWGSLVMPILCFGKSEKRSSAGQLPCQTWQHRCSAAHRSKESLNW